MAYRRTPAVQERLDATRVRIVAAAHGLVAERGYAGCSVAQVAAAAGVATGSVYRHFPDKGALFAEVFRAATQREVDAVAHAGRTPGPVGERITRAVETFAHRALRSPRLAYALIAEPVDPQVESQRLVFRGAYRAIFAAVITEAVAAGELPAQDAEVSAAGVVGAMAEALILPLHTATGPAGNPATVPELTAFVLRSLGATSSTTTGATRAHA